MKGVIKNLRVSFFSTVNREQVIEKLNQSLSSIQSKHSYYSFKRNWERYSDILNFNDLISESDGKSKLSLPEIKRSELIVDTILNFTKDELTVFFVELDLVLKNQNYSCSKESNKSRINSLAGFLISLDSLD